MKGADGRGGRGPGVAGGDSEAAAGATGRAGVLHRVRVEGAGVSRRKAAFQTRHRAGRGAREAQPRSPRPEDARATQVSLRRRVAPTARLLPANKFVQIPRIYTDSVYSLFIFSLRLHARLKTIPGNAGRICTRSARGRRAPAGRGSDPSRALSSGSRH